MCAFVCACKLRERMRASVRVDAFSCVYISTPVPVLWLQMENKILCNARAACLTQLCAAHHITHQINRLRLPPLPPFTCSMNDCPLPGPPPHLQCYNTRTYTPPRPHPVPTLSWKQLMELKYVGVTRCLLVSIVTTFHRY